MFNLYLAGGFTNEPDDYIIDKGMNRLFSYLNEMKPIKYFDSQIKEKGSSTKLFIDSGAFSVAHQGAYVDLEAYIDFINEHIDLGVFAILDTIPFPILNLETAKVSAEESWKTYVYMHEKVIQPEKLIMVYHFGETEEHFNRILNTEVNGKLPEYIGIGGRHGVSMKDQEGYFKRRFDMIKHSKNPNVKVHAFGMTALRVLERYPFHSADSTTWLKIAAYGGILTDYGIITMSNVQKYNADTYYGMQKQEQEIINGVIKEFGYTVEELQESYKSRLKYNVDYLHNWATNYVYKPVTAFKKSII